MAKKQKKEIEIQTLPEILTVRIFETRLRQIKASHDYAGIRIVSLREDIWNKASNFTQAEKDAYDRLLAGLHYRHLGDKIRNLLSRALLAQDRETQKHLLEQALEEFKTFQSLLEEDKSLSQVDPQMHDDLLGCGDKISEILVRLQARPNDAPPLPAPSDSAAESSSVELSSTSADR